MTKTEKIEVLKTLATVNTTTAISEYDDPTLNLFGSDLFMFIEYGDISELYIRNSLCFLLSHDIINVEQYKALSAVITGAVELHETSYDE